MSLRLRLTLLYTTLLGGVLLIFGALVYGLVSVILQDQMDTSLSQSAERLVAQLRVNASGQFDPRSIAGLQLADTLVFQIWGNDNKLQLSRPPKFHHGND